MKNLIEKDTTLVVQELNNKIRLSCQKGEDTNRRKENGWCGID